MNYLKQVNKFYEFLLINPLNANSQCLYFALLNINNKCNWLKNFTVANITLMTFTGLNISALQRARNNLIQKGYVKYQKGKSNNAGIYEIIEFEQHNEQQSEQHNEQQSEQHNEQYSEQQNDSTTNNTTNILNKQNKTKQNKISSSSIKFYIENINPLISPFEVELLNSYCDDLSDEIVIYAIQEAIEHNAKNMKYIKKILDRYVAQGLSSIEQIKAQNSFNKKQETLEEETERLRKEWGLSDED